MKIFLKLTLCTFVLALSSCTTQKAGSGYSADSLTLDTAIAETASYFIGRLPSGAKVAVVPFDAPTGRLSDYVFGELWTRFEDSGNFVMVDRRNLDRIEAEIKHQLESGRVDDDQVVSITRQYGAQILVYGQMSSLDNEFESKQNAVVPYSGRNNRWAFTVTPDVLDGIYYAGDYMTMRIYSARDCYFRIIHVDVNGNAQGTISKKDHQTVILY